MPTDDEVLRASLAFAGSHSSDDGTVTVARYDGPTSGYGDDRFVGRCVVCTRAGLLLPAGEALSDLAAALTFLALHDHGLRD